MTATLVVALRQNEGSPNKFSIFLGTGTSHVRNIFLKTFLCFFRKIFEFDLIFFHILMGDMRIQHDRDEWSFSAF